jgi:NHL repeat-containing protein
MKLRFIIFVFFLFLFSNTAHAQIITTIAGCGACNSLVGDGGPATDAGIFSPSFVTMDAANNIYVSDDAANRIRKVDASGIISTIAGVGDTGYSGDHGAATAAKLYDPTGLAFDGRGNLYFADWGNNCIRKIDTAGIITTVAGVAGVASYGGDNGPATLAYLNNPEGIAIDKKGNLFIVDGNNNLIRKVDTAGTITTFAGGGTGSVWTGGPATAASLLSPIGVATDTLGNIYFAVWGGHFPSGPLIKVDAMGIMSPIAGGGTYQISGYPDTDIAFYVPTGVAADVYGNVYISSAGTGTSCCYVNTYVWKVAPTGFAYIVAGNGTPGFSGDGGPAVDAELGNPYGLAVDMAGDIYSRWCTTALCDLSSFGTCNSCGTR